MSVLCGSVLWSGHECGKVLNVASTTVLCN